MIWNTSSDYPGVEEFALKMKEALMKAHDAIIGARIKQMDQANRHRRKADFSEGDLVYLSTKNLSLPQGRTRKLIPKYIGPFKILRIASPGSSYQLELPRELKSKGIYDVFHASLLRRHFPNDDRCFPGRQLHQLLGLGHTLDKWSIDRVLSHAGRGTDAVFEIQWSTGNVTWAPYAELKGLSMLDEYLEVMGVAHPKQLRPGRTDKEPVVGLSVMDFILEGLKEVGRRWDEFAGMPSAPRREMPPPDRSCPYRPRDNYYYRREHYHMDSYCPPTPPILDRTSEVTIGNRTFDALFERQQRNMEWQQEMILRLYSDRTHGPGPRQPSSTNPARNGARFMRAERNEGPRGRRRTGPFAKPVRGSQKPPGGDKPTEAQKQHTSSTQNDSQAASNSGMSLSDRISPKNPVVAPRSSKRNQNRNDKKKPEADVMDTELDQYKDETTRLREKYLAENPLPSNLAEHRMDVDDTRAPGWGDSHRVDDGMAPEKL